MSRAFQLRERISRWVLKNYFHCWGAPAAAECSVPVDHATKVDAAFRVGTALLLQTFRRYDYLQEIIESQCRSGAG